MRAKYLTILAGLALLLSCQKNEDPISSADYVRMAAGFSPELNFDRNGKEENQIKILVSGNWTATTDASWLSISPASGNGPGTRTLSIKASENTFTEPRSAEIIVSCGASSLLIKAIQDKQLHLYKIIAHRGGFRECNLPECSIASLKYTIDLHCYGSECDVMWTADNQVLVCHPDGNGKVNGLIPCENTLEQIRAAGKLPNGEQMPSLQDFLAVIADKEINQLGTKLWLDIKGPSTEMQGKVIERSAEIAKEMGVCDKVEFLIPGGYTYVATAADLKARYGIRCAWNGKIADASTYGNGGWAQLPYSSYKASAYWPPTTYTQQGITVSIYHTPSSKSYAAFYADCLPYYNELKALFVNHPADCIKALIDGGYEEAE